MNRTLLI